MSKQKETAGKTAKSKTGAKWHTVTIKGKGALRSPDGRTYYGTAKEIREANLYPWERDDLAERLRVYRKAFQKATDRLDYVAGVRRDTIRERTQQYIINGNSDRAMDRKILTIAAARFLGESVEDFIADAIEGSISATIDRYHSETGKWSLPLSRHEAATLNSDIRDWSDSAMATIA